MQCWKKVLGCCACGAVEWITDLAYDILIPAKVCFDCSRSELGTLHIDGFIGADPVNQLFCVHLES
jgi:hypothetical protein